MNDENYWNDEDIALFLQQLNTISAQFFDDLRIILEPTINQMIEIMNEHQANENRPNPKHLTDPRFRKKKGRTTWR